MQLLYYVQVRGEYMSTVLPLRRQSERNLYFQRCFPSLSEHEAVLLEFLYSQCLLGPVSILSWFK